MRSSLDILILKSTPHRIPRSFLKHWVGDVRATLLREKISSASRRQLLQVRELSLIFVSSTEIRRLNREFRKKNKATDVLSFAPSEEESLGELVFSLDVIKRQALEHGLSFQDELGYMVLHGILHLLGYDHETSSSDERRMFAIQDRVFEKLT